MRNLTLFLVIFLATNRPQVRFHGLLAVGEVFLGEEGGLVLGDLGQVFLTLDDHLSYGFEAETDCTLVVRERGCTGDVLQGTDVHTRTVFAGGRSGAVRSQNHLLVISVLRLFVDFGKRSRNGFVERYRSCNSHSLLAMTRTTARSALV